MLKGSRGKIATFVILSLLLMSMAGASFYIHQQRLEEQTQRAALQKAKKDALAKEKQAALKRKEQQLLRSDIQFPIYGEKYATISCERVNFFKDLYYGDSDSILDIAIGQFTGSHMPGEGMPIMVAGHNGTHFTLLPTMQEGDIIKINTTYGEYQYRITSSEIIEASAFSQEQLEEKREYLILYTCYPFNQIVGVTQRYFVYADYVSGKQIVNEYK